MQEKSVLTGHLSELKQKIENGLEELKSSKELYEFKSEYLEGKKSKISGLMKEMKNIARLLLKFLLTSSVSSCYLLSLCLQRLSSTLVLRTNF